MSENMNDNESLREAVEILSRTPGALRSLLAGLSEPWIRSNEGTGTWNPHDVLGHLIHGEKTDWIPRARMILEHGESKTFEKFDREAMFSESGDKTLAQLLDEFSNLREQNIQALKQIISQGTSPQKTGIHPELGRVTLGQLIATWAVHDLDHISQIARTMALRYDTKVGPWKKFLKIVSHK